MTCYIFDLDGVLTSLMQKAITNPSLLPLLEEILEQNDLITLNTGRGLPFIHDQILGPMQQHLTSKHLSHSLLNDFFAVGEKGNAWIQNAIDFFDTSITIPEDFASAVKQVIEKDFSDTMFFDTSKRTMISIEMHTGLEIEKFSAVREKLIQTLKSLLKEYRLIEDFIIDPTLTAADIQHKSAGKAKGIERILHWVSEKRLEPEKYIAFGDSAADVDMGEALKRANKNFEFVFVGDPHLIATKPSFPVIFTNSRYDKGVIEFLT